MDIRHLNLVLMVAEERTLTKAASRLHLTQSALSYQLRQLETDLGTPLFERTGKRMVLNQAGERLLSTAHLVLDELERARYDIEQLAAGKQGRIRISTGCYTCYHWLPPLIDVFRQDYPNIDVQIVAEATHDPIQFLRNGHLDLAIVSTLPPDPNLHAHPLFEDQIMVLARPDHPFTHYAYIEAEQLAAEHLILYAGDHAGVLHKVLYPAGIRPRQISQIQLTEAILELVKAGMGVSIMSQWAIAPHVASGSLVARPLTPEGFRRPWYAVSHGHASTPTYQHAFIELLATNLLEGRTGLKNDRQEVVSGKA